MREARRREPVVFGAEEKAQQRRRPPRERIPAAGEGRDAQQKGKMLDLNYGGKTVADEKKAKKTTARPKMDPKKKRRIILWVVLTALFLGALLFSAFKVMRVHEVTFRGLVHVAEDYATGLSGVKKGTHIFNVDRSAIEANINADPYLVYEATTYIFPDTLVIDVRERQERAAIAIANSYVVIDEDCVILRQTEAGDVPDVAEVIGLEISEFTPGYELRSTDTYKQETLKYVLEAVIYSGLTGSIEEINMIDVNDIHLTTTAGMEIVLGQRENANEKLLLAKSVIDYLAKEGKTSGTLDVTTDGQASYMAEPETLLPNTGTTVLPNDTDATASPTPGPTTTANAGGTPEPTTTSDTGATPGPTETPEPSASATPGPTATPEPSATLEPESGG